MFVNNNHLYLIIIIKQKSFTLKRPFAKIWKGALFIKNNYENRKFNKFFKCCDVNHIF